MDGESEELKLLRENNMMLKELLEIARKHTSQDLFKQKMIMIFL